MENYTNEILLREIENRMKNINNISDSELINEILSRNLENDILNDFEDYKLYNKLDSRGYDFLNEFYSEELLDEIVYRDDEYLIDIIKIDKFNNFSNEKLKRHLCDIVDVGYLTDINIIMEKLRKMI